MQKQEILDSNVVKIIILHKYHGTGIMFDNPDESKYLYVFTAKHNLYYRNENEEKEIRVDICDVSVQHCLERESFISFEVVDILDSQSQDFSILMIERQSVCKMLEIKSYSLEEKIINNKREVFFKGFPQKLNGEEAHKLYALVNEINGKSFEITIESGELFDFDNDALQNCKGFSGSGIFVSYPNGIIKLVGILTSYKAFNTLKGCFFANEVNGILVRNNYKPILSLTNPPKKKTMRKANSMSLADYSPKEYYKNIEGENLKRLEQKVFSLICQGYAVLIVGPSILAEGENIDMNIIQSFRNNLDTNIDFDSEDLEDFVNVVFADENYSREKFDDSAYHYLDSLPIPKIYRQISKIKWKSIITTNMDKTLGKAYDDEPKSTQNISNISNLKEFKADTLPDVLQYIKLNGDIRDRGAYPLVFSSKDFEKADKFYSRIKSYLNDLSNRIPIIAIGFHQNDSYAQTHFKKLSLDRSLYSIDPSINNDLRLKSEKENNRYIIKTDAENFFEHYEVWKDSKEAKQLQRRRQSFVDRNDKIIYIPNDIQIKLNNNVIQLGGRQLEKIRPIEFYEGKEPNYSVVNSDYDVPKRNKLEEVKTKILSILEEDRSISICLLTGSFGTGKSTFTLRLIKEIINSKAVLAFHVLDFEQLKVDAINELIARSECEKIILYTDRLEVDTAFNAVLNFNKLYQDSPNPRVSVLILSSIRENILNRYNKSEIFRDQFKSINIDAPFTREEIESLVEKWEKVKLQRYKDKAEKISLINKIEKDYKGDTLTASYNLINSSKHETYIRNAYEELESSMKKAFLYTSLLDRFKIRMPYGLLKDILNISYKDFDDEVIRGEGLGIIIHDMIDNVTGLNPDIYFSTRHPTIADKLVTMKVKNQKTLCNYYSIIINNVKINDYYCRTTINLLKAIEKQKSLSTKFLNKLYDEAYKSFEKFPRFILSYSINLQKRDRVNGRYNKTDNLQKAFNVIMQIRSEIEETIYKRDHYLIHRQGIISFNLAKYFLDKYRMIDAQSKFDEAKEYFESKKSLDPNSIYSYFDFIKLCLWGLENADRLKWDNYMVSEVKNQLEILFEESIYAYGSKNKIKELENEYRGKYGLSINISNDIDIEEEIDKHPQIELVNILVQLYYQWSGIKEEKSRKLSKVEKKKNRNLRMIESLEFEIAKYSEKLERVVDQLVQYEDQETVTMILFKHYGRNLYIPDYRVKFFKLINDYNYIEKKDQQRFHYFNFVASCYDEYFRRGYEHLDEIRKIFGSRINPNTFKIWKDSDGLAKIFTGNIKQRHKRDFVKVRDFQRNVPIIKGKSKVNSSVKVKVYFYLSGLKAEIVEDISE